MEKSFSFVKLVHRARLFVVKAHTICIPMYTANRRLARIRRLRGQTSTFSNSFSACAYIINLISLRVISIFSFRSTKCKCYRVRCSYAIILFRFSDLFFYLIKYGCVTATFVHLNRREKSKLLRPQSFLFARARLHIHLHKIDCSRWAGVCDRLAL